MSHRLCYKPKGLWLLLNQQLLTSLSTCLSGSPTLIAEGAAVEATSLEDTWWQLSCHAKIPVGRTYIPLFFSIYRSRWACQHALYTHLMSSLQLWVHPHSFTTWSLRASGQEILTLPHVAWPWWLLKLWSKTPQVPQSCIMHACKTSGTCCQVLLPAWYATWSPWATILLLCADPQGNTFLGGFFLLFV